MKRKKNHIVLTMYKNWKEKKNLIAWNTHNEKIKQMLEAREILLPIKNGCGGSEKQNNLYKYVK